MHQHIETAPIPAPPSPALPSARGAAPACSLPVGAEGWNPALVGAFRKGMAAFHAGEDRSCCPYADKRKASGRLSGSRAFIRAWDDGWLWAQHLANQLSLF